MKGAVEMSPSLLQVWIMGQGLLWKISPFGNHFQDFLHVHSGHKKSIFLACSKPVFFKIQFSKRMLIFALFFKASKTSIVPVLRRKQGCNKPTKMHFRDHCVNLKCLWRCELWTNRQYQICATLFVRSLALVHFAFSPLLQCSVIDLLNSRVPHAAQQQRIDCR